MSERDSYPAGVPCWVETLQPDPRAALEFYGALFGWEPAGPAAMPDNPGAEYFVARVRGRDVAGIGSLPADPGAAPAAAWTTHVRVDRVDDAVARIERAGGSIVVAPFDVPPVGRVAVATDPAGAAFCVWEGHAREGAQILNEPSAWAMSMLHTTDPEGAERFYGEVFGWRPEPFGPPEAGIRILRLPGYVGGEPEQPVPRDVVAVMAPNAGDVSAEPHWRVDFWIADADAAVAHTLASGGSVLVAPHDTPAFRQAVLADPAGAAFSISQLTAVK